jgi:hypothetical protein
MSLMKSKAKMAAVSATVAVVVLACLVVIPLLVRHSGGDRAHRAPNATESPVSRAGERPVVAASVPAQGQRPAGGRGAASLDGFLKKEVDKTAANATGLIYTPKDSAGATLVENQPEGRCAFVAAAHKSGALLITSHDENTRSPVLWLCAGEGSSRKRVPDGNVVGVAGQFSYDDRFIVYQRCEPVTRAYSFDAYDTASGQSSVLHEGEVSCFSLSPRENEVVYVPSPKGKGAAMRALYFCDLEGKSKRRLLEVKPEEPIGSVSFSPDGQTIALSVLTLRQSAGKDGKDELNLLFLNKTTGAVAKPRFPNEALANLVKQDPGSLLRASLCWGDRDRLLLSYGGFMYLVRTDRSSAERIGPQGAAFPVWDKRGAGRILFSCSKLARRESKIYALPLPRGQGEQ